MSHKKAPKYYYLDRKWHFCPGLNSATKFTKWTIFRDGLPETGKFANLTIFRDDLTKAKRFTNLTIFRHTLTKSGAADFTILTVIAKFTNFTIFSSESSAVFTTCSPSLGTTSNNTSSSGGADFTNLTEIAKLMNFMLFSILSQPFSLCYGNKNTTSKRCCRCALFYKRSRPRKFRLQKRHMICFVFYAKEPLPYRITQNDS